MCCATQPPQVSNQGQIGVARSGAELNISTSSPRLPSSLTRARSPGRAPGTIAPLAVSPCPCASSAAIETSSSGSAIARADEKFPRAGSAEDGRRNEAEHNPPLRLDGDAHRGACPLERRLVLDPAFDEIGAIKLELWLDEAEEPSPVAGELEDMRQYKPLGNEAHIDDDRFWRFAERRRRERARVDTFERAD